MTDTGDEHRVILAWFADRLVSPCAEPLDVRVDREEILLVVPLVLAPLPPDIDEVAAARAAITAFREASRDQRVAVAEEGQHRFGRTVSWGVACRMPSGRVLEELFTVVTVPVMTRLRMGERAVLDTLIEAGVARSRSEAVAWCVRLVGRHEDDWLGELRLAMQELRRVRAQGPDRRDPADG